MNSHKLWRQAVSQLRGTGRSRINLENVAELLLPKPPLDEQLKITETLQTVGEQIERENKYHENLKELKRGLMQDLLTGKVRVDTA
jgi:type I restriction enzyme S subunit